ncbi:MAG: hypothetical protein UU48_C0006G0028 [Candidatus Uhrbacteria bacterium GW2011_GWF2_41_16]|uniref:Uncharacterized protein n=2 Tax=Candidatus Uhriibacteriota TaxID=1752732 RepID=A0A0G0VAH0_9BACT|nr:MAG: hypothetical protein UU35_C0007G0105 [Candidatus Uhrbacteria bacterium GW2011_GWC2_41_11]KKR97988.1 MAG: hypothetical protein UU48_C0006G0028 [Candidatus Uhrbacteria bacterium GW2011_GWF2_41_16]
MSTKFDPNNVHQVPQDKDFNFVKKISVWQCSHCGEYNENGGGVGATCAHCSRTVRGGTDSFGSYYCMECKTMTTNFARECSGCGRDF